MKKSKILGLLLIAISISSTSLKAQVSEPDFIGEAYLLKNDISIILLDKEIADYTTGVSWSSNSCKALSIEISGDKAQTRFSSDESLKIVVRAADNNSDPLAIISVYKFKSAKNKRTVVLSEDNSWTVMESGTDSKDMVRFNGKKFGTSSYIIELNNLKPGEYGILVSNPNSRDEKRPVVATFGISQTQNSDLFNANSMSLTERWELGLEHQKGTFLPTAYKPTYILLGNLNTNPNTLPQSENPLYSFSEQQPMNALELKFQLSFKTKILQGIFGRHGDLWVAYTQSSRWQVYSQESSRPFRETNYEPEAILNFATNYRLFGFKGSLLGVTFTHQSNGQALPSSRSWNRVIFQLGFEKENWNIVLRPWIRIKDDDDENPAIADYAGRADLLVVHNWRNQQFSILGRHSLRSGENNHGSFQLDWALPLFGNLKGHLQIFQGYGESMIDYNYKQATFGVGISMIEW
ncbi:MAG: phospholipase A [Flavobacterium sp.]|nr:phospholipase A [Flavobacterium sp.]